MVSKKLVKALNEHINLEMYSGYLYLAMSIKTHEENYKGYSSWLFKQYQEEFEHSHDFIHFMQQRDMSVELKPVQVEPIKETDPLKIAKLVLEHERNVTKSIYKLHDLAKQENDYATRNFICINALMNKFKKKTQHKISLINLHLRRKHFSKILSLIKSWVDELLIQETGVINQNPPVSFFNNHSFYMFAMINSLGNLKIISLFG
ncbi:MAG: ferritin [Eubacteriales bacterium]